MCYKKPGPRCSGHAKKALEKVKQDVAKDPSERNRDRLQQAIADYDSTPAGQRSLQHRIDATGDLTGQYAARLKDGKQRRADALRSYEIAYGDRLEDGASKMLMKEASAKYLASGAMKNGTSYEDYYQSTNNKHFLAEGSSEEERVAFLSRPGSQFDPEKASSIQSLLAKVYERDPEYLRTGDDREKFIADGADPKSFLPICRYLKVEGFGGHVGTMRTEDLPDDTPLSIHEKSPGSNIISFVVERDEKPYVDYSTVIIGPVDADGDITNRDTLENNACVWTAFPGAASRQDPRRKDRTPEEQAEHDKQTHERALRLQKEGRLTVGEVREHIKDGREFDVNVRVRS